MKVNPLLEAPLRLRLKARLEVRKRGKGSREMHG
jgi:hypothetical protein